jgi:TonB family protein
MGPSRRNLSLTVALCASLTAHALLLVYLADRYVRLMDGHIGMPAPRWLALAAPEAPPPPEDPLDRAGEADGVGRAILAAPGELPLLAQQATHDQPFLSLDPVGAGQIGDPPSESALPPAVQAPAAPPPQVAPPPTLFAAPADAAPALAGVASSLESLGEPYFSKLSAQSSAEEPAIAAAPPAPAADAPAAAGASADPAPQAESESDPTSMVGSAEFRPGATDVQIGRKVKITRPRLSLAAKADLVTQRTRPLVLKLKLDESGKVTSAEVFRSSGSLAVDQPCQVAAYSWWFEPLKNDEGKSVKDVILFTIRFI